MISPDTVLTHPSRPVAVASSAQGRPGLSVAARNRRDLFLALCACVSGAAGTTCAVVGAWRFVT